MSPLPAIELTCIPAGCMFVFTLVGLGVHVPETIAGALQHFAAGILLCTIGTELLPIMDEAKGFEMNLACFFGFFAGVFVMLLLGNLEHEDDDDDEEGNVEVRNSVLKHITGDGLKMSRLRGRGSILKASIAASTQGRQSVIPTENQSLLSNQSVRGVFPLALIFTIAIDGAMDGLLIGIAMAAGPSAGPMMAASLCVEMSFLGVTLALALKGHERFKSLVAATVGPLGMIFGAAIGGMLSNALSSNPMALSCLLSFGTSALLFMVAEELLLEAHEDGDHVWWIDLQLYTGFFASIIMGKFL